MGLDYPIKSAEYLNLYIVLSIGKQRQMIIQRYWIKWDSLCKRASEVENRHEAAYIEKYN